MLVMKGLLATLLLAAGGAGDGGALPKGDLKKLDQSMKNAPQDAGKKGSCYQDLAAPPGGNGVFSPDGSTLWLLATTEAKKGKRKLTLYKVDLAGRSADAVLAIDYRPSASLITHASPVAAVSIVSFTGESAGCADGPATMVSVRLDKSGGKAVQLTGEYQLVATPEDWVIVDKKKQMIPEVDLTTFQMKTGRRLAKAERPLFYDRAGERLIVWFDDGRQRGLVRYDGAVKPKQRRVAIKPGDRVLQNGDRFAVARLDVKANEIEVQELGGWSRSGGKPGSFTVTVPPAYPIGGVGLAASFGARRLIAFGATTPARQRWQRVFVYDYTQPEAIATVTVSEKQVVFFAGMDPTGALAVMEVRDLASGLTKGLKIFDFAKKAAEDLELPAPR